MSGPAVLVVPVTMEQLRKLIADAVREATTVPAGDEWVPVKSCGLPPTTRRRLTREGVLPVSKVGRGLRVKRADVERYIASRVSAAPAGDELDRALARGRL